MVNPKKRNCLFIIVVVVVVLFSFKLVSKLTTNFRKYIFTAKMANRDVHTSKCSKTKWHCKVTHA